MQGVVADVILVIVDVAAVESVAAVVDVAVVLEVAAVEGVAAVVKDVAVVAVVVNLVDVAVVAYVFFCCSLFLAPLLADTKYAREIIQYILNQISAQCCKILQSARCHCSWQQSRILPRLPLLLPFSFSFQHADTS